MEKGRRRAEILMINPQFQLEENECLDYGRVSVFNDSGSAEQYLKTIEEGKRPDIILLDSGNFNCLDLLKRIKLHPGLRAIPVIVLSGLNDQHITDSYQSFANCLINTPDNLKQYKELFHSISNFWLTVAVLPGQQSDLNYYGSTYH